MHKRINIFILMMMMLFITFSSAEAIGQRQDGELDTPYIISQPCATCTYMNISVFTKNGLILDNVAMLDNGSTWTYTFTPNTTLRYDVNGIGDINGVADSFAFFFDVTLSGERNTSGIIVADIFLILILSILIFLIVIKYKGIDFDKWNDRIVKEHENMGKTFIKGLGFGLMKFCFVWYYLLGWIMLFVLRDIIIRFNSYEIYTYFVLILNIYSLGFILVMIFLIGYFVKYIRDMINLLMEDSWGVGQ